MEDYQGASQLTLTELNNEVQIEQQFILLSISDQDIVLSTQEVLWRSKSNNSLFY